MREPYCTDMLDLHEQTYIYTVETSLDSLHQQIDFENIATFKSTTVNYKENTLGQI